MYGTEAQLRNAIEQMRSDKALRDRLGREGRTAYEAEFADGPFLRHYTALVGELLARKRAGKPIVEPHADGHAVVSGRPAFC